MENEQRIGVRLVYYGLVCSKKNNKRAVRNRKTGQLGLVSSHIARANEEDIIRSFVMQRPRYKIPSPVVVTIDIYEPNYTRRDLDNQTATIFDALTKAGIIEDDSINHVIEFWTRLAGFDKNAPRAVVHVEHKTWTAIPENEYQSGMRLVYYGLVHSKKNSKRVIRNRKTGQLGIITSRVAKESEDDMIRQFSLQRPSHMAPSPATVSVDMYEPNRARRDLDNQSTSILDALTRARIIEDDSIRHVTGIHGRLAGFDKKMPRAVVYVSDPKQECAC